MRLGSRRDCTTGMGRGWWWWCGSGGARQGERKKRGRVVSEEKRHGGVSFFDRQTAVCPRCYLPPFPSSPSNVPWRGCRQHSTWPQRRSETRSMPRGAATTRTKMTKTKTPTPTKRRSEMPPRKQQLLRSLHLRLQPALRSPCGRPALGGRAVGRPPSRSRAWSFFWKGARKKREEEERKQ